jgi:hypothetical protein
MIGAAVVELTIHLYASELLINRVSHAVLNAMRFPIAAFYEERDSLTSATEELKDVQELWAAWHSGTVAHTKEFFPKGRKGRLILTHPKSVQMKELEKVSEKSAEGLATDIKELTKALIEKSVDVKWFDGPVCNSILVANPKSNSAWIRVEIVVPKKPAGKRPSFLVKKASNKKLFDTLYESYIEMWNASKTPE